MKATHSLTENTNMHQSHHFGSGSQHQQQNRPCGAPVSHSPDQKLLRQTPVTQHQFTRQDQQTAGIHNMANNRIVATNMNRDRSQGKPQSPLHNQTPLNVQTPVLQFAKKINIQNEKPIAIPNQSQQYQKITARAPSPQISFTFQSHTHPTRAMTAETKKFIQK
jgi:hypothetical protein